MGSESLAYLMKIGRRNTSSCVAASLPPTPSGGDALAEWANFSHSMGDASWRPGTVRDLVAGSGLEFSDRAKHQLKGVPGEWQVYEAV